MFPGESQTVLVTHSVKILAKYQQILTKKLNQSSQPRDANAAMTPTPNSFPFRNSRVTVVTDGRVRR